MEVILKYRTSVFITSQKKFITMKNSIFSIVKRQGNKLQLIVQVISLRNTGRLSFKADNVGLIFWHYLTKFLGKQFQNLGLKSFTAEHWRTELNVIN